jgi:hypothetical protein
MSNLILRVPLFFLIPYARILYLQGLAYNRHAANVLVLVDYCVSRMRDNRRATANIRARICMHADTQSRKCSEVILIMNGEPIIRMCFSKAIEAYREGYGKDGVYGRQPDFKFAPRLVSSRFPCVL